MTRTEELNSIDYFRIADISKILKIDANEITFRIGYLGLIPFESWFYSKEQIQLIDNYQTQIL